MTDTTSYRYWAFISYCRGDKRWARWLHQALETYAIPGRLVGQRTPAGESAPGHFRPLFRDRSELPAAADLDAQIEDALRASRYLIVICSPGAAKSVWVNKEIEAFVGLGRADRVLAIIVDGQPNTGDEQECFPAALRVAEPIAADARRDGDGKDNAKLKLVAGMLGVGFDVLKQRDSHRRIRQFQLAAGFSLILAAGFAGLAFYAERQRAKAVAARQQAEGILEYLLFDLRDKLEPVGRLDIVRDAQVRVDAFYAALGSEKGDPRTQRNEAVAQGNKGDRLLAQGDLVGGLREYRASLAISERLALTDPGNVVWQRDVFVSHNEVGDVLLAQGDMAGALREYRESLAISERLASSDLGNATWQRDMSVSHGNLGNVMQLQGDLGSALREYREDLAITERLALSDPVNTAWQREMAVGHANVGRVMQMQGDLAGALREYREDLAIVDHLASAAPGNGGWQRDLSVSHGRIGDVLQAQGDFAGALLEYQRALGISERLASSDPSNANWQRDVSVNHEKVGEVLQTRGDLAGALREFRRYLLISKRLVSLHPGNTTWQRDVSLGHNNVGEVLQAQGNLAGALLEFRESLTISERLAQADTSNAVWQRDVWLGQVSIAEAIEKTGQAGAMAWWRRACEQLSGMKRRGTMQPTDEKRFEQIKRKAGA